jgi:hypothetical protein
MLGIAGDSRTGAAITDGDLVIVSEQPDADCGGIVAAIFAGEVPPTARQLSRPQEGLDAAGAPSPDSRAPCRKGPASSSAFLTRRRCETAVRGTGAGAAVARGSVRDGTGAGLHLFPAEHQCGFRATVNG